MKKKIYMAPRTLVVEMCETEMLCVSGGITDNLEDLGEEEMDPASGELLKTPDLWEDEW